MAAGAFELRTPDVDRVHALASGLLGPFQLALRTTRYDAHVRHDPLGNLSFTSIGYGNPVEIAVASTPAHLVVQWAATGAFDAQTSGAELRACPTNLHLVRPDVPLRMRCSPDCRFVIV